MILSLALCVLAAPQEAPPRASIQHAGFLRDARLELRADRQLAFAGRIDWPATITRRSFVVEALGADGTLLFSRPVTASAARASGRHKRAVEAHFELELPALEGVREVHVRCAN